MHSLILIVGVEGGNDDYKQQQRSKCPGLSVISYGPDYKLLQTLYVVGSSLLSVTSFRRSVSWAQRGKMEEREKKRGTW